jgi:hypothetical protein
LTQQVSGTVVLLDPDNGEYYALDEVGSRIWELCDDAPAETVEADVLELVEDLIREKLVVEAAEAAGPAAAAPRSAPPTRSCTIGCATSHGIQPERARLSPGVPGEPLEKEKTYWSCSPYLANAVASGLVPAASAPLLEPC